MSSDPTEWEGHRAPRPVSIFTDMISLCYGQDSIPGSVAQSLNWLHYTGCYFKMSFKKNGRWKVWKCVL